MDYSLSFVATAATQLPLHRNQRPCDGLAAACEAMRRQTRGRRFSTDADAKRCGGRREAMRRRRVGGSIFAKTTPSCRTAHNPDSKRPSMPAVMEKWHVRACVRASVRNRSKCSGLKIVRIDNLGFTRGGREAVHQQAAAATDAVLSMTIRGPRCSCFDAAGTSRNRTP